MCTSWPLSPISLTPTSILATTNLLCFHEHRSLVGWLKIPPVSDNIWYLSFSVWLISLNIIPSRSTHVVVNYKFLFFYFWMSSIPLCMCIYVCVCVYLFEYIFSFSLDIYPEVELLGQMVVLLFVFEETPCYFPQWLHQFTFPPTVYSSVR